MTRTFSIIALLTALPAFAEETRQLDAHEHGVGTLDIAIDGSTVAMAFRAPGADIVGFEYAAESDADLAAVDAALETLGAPLALFVLPDAAGCTVTSAEAEVEIEGAHDEHAHDDHGDDDHDDAAHEDDDHGHEDHSDAEHDDHGDEVNHSEFHAEYTLQCDSPDALTDITFAYFEAFPNAQKVDVQLVSGSGAQAFEVTRAAPVLTLGG